MPKQINVKLGFEADTSQAKKQIQDLQKSLNDLTVNKAKNSFGKELSDDFLQAEQSVLKFKAVLESSLNENGTLNTYKLSQNMQAVGMNAEELARQFSILGPEGKQAFSQITQSIVTAQKPIAQTTSSIEKLWTALKNTARWQLSSSILHGFMGALQGAYGYAQDLNASLNSIRIVSGQSVDQMAAFADQANRAAQALSTSTLAYTDAALIFYQQGLSGDAVTERVETVLKMSNVTGDSAETVSSYMTAIWNNFYDGSESLESFADKITALGAATASSSAEIANGLQQFAAIGETVGLSYDYAATALATVVAQTRQSESVVGNAFRTIFSRLQGLKLGETLDDGTDLNKYSKALLSVGVDIKDANGELRTMDSILDDLGEKWQSLSRDTQMALAQTVGGTRQYAQIIALMDNWDFFQQNLEVTQNAEGTLQEQADIYAESWEAAQKRVKAAWQAIYQDLIDDKFFITILNGIETVLKGVDSLIDALGDWKGVLGVIGVVLTTVFSSQLGRTIDGAREHIKQLNGEMKAASDALTNTFVNARLSLSGNATGPEEAETNAFNTQQQFYAKLEEAKTKVSEIDARTIDLLIEQNKLYQEQEIKLKNNAQLKQQEYEVLRASTASIKNDKLSKYIDTGLGGNKYYSKQSLESDAKQLTRLDQNSDEYKAQYEEIISVIQKRTKATDEEVVALKKLLDKQVEVQRAIEEGIKAESNAADHTAATGEAVEKLVNKKHDDTNATEENSDALERNNQLQKENAELKEKNASLPDVKPPSLNLSTDQIVASARAISLLTAGITSLVSAVTIWTDKSKENLSVGEKTKQTLMSLAAAIPTLMMGYKTLAVDILGLTAKEVTLSKVLTTQIPIINGLKISLAEFVVIGALVAGVVYGIYKWWNKDADAAKAAAKAATEAKEAYEEARQEFDNLINTLENHQDAVKALEDLKEGTLEWHKAVQAINSDVLELLDKFPELAEFVKVENGVYQISEQGMQTLANLQYKNLIDKQIDSFNASAKSTSAGWNSDITDLGRRYRVGRDDDSISGLSNSEVKGLMAAWEDSGGKAFESTKKLGEALDKLGYSVLAADQTFLQTVVTQKDLINELQSSYNSGEINDISRDLQARQLAQQGVSNEIGRDISSFLQGSSYGYLDSSIEKILEDEVAQAMLEAEELTGDAYQDILQSYRDSFNENAQDYLDQAIVNETQTIDSIPGLRDFYDQLTNEDKRLFLTMDIDENASAEQVKAKFAEFRENIKDDLDGLKLYLDADVDEEEWEALSEYLYENADKINENAEAQERLSDDLLINKQAAAEVAEAILRFDDAIQDVSDNYEEWMDMLHGTSQDLAKVGPLLADAYGDLLDIDGSQLDATFLENTHNLELMKQATENVAGAYDELAAQAAQSILLKVGLSDTEALSKFQEDLAWIQSFDFPNMGPIATLKVGTELDNQQFLNKLTEMVNAAHMTRDQALAYLGSMGINAEITQHDAEAEETQEITGFQANITHKEDPDSFYSIPSGTNDAAPVALPGMYPEVTYEPNTTITTSTKKATGFTLEVTSATKSSGGNFKYNQATHGAGSGGAGNTRNKGKSGGGGSSKKKTVKEHKKPEEKTDRYHDIKERIADLNTELKRLEKTESRVYGKAKLKYMDQEIEKLEKQIELTDEYIAEIKKYAATDQANLRGIGMGATFDENGRLTNYEQVLANIVSSYNSAVATYNGAVDSFNASAQEDADSARLDAAEKTLTAAKETYDKRLKILDQYEDTYNLLQEKMDERIDQVWALFDKRLEQITWRVEFEIDWNEKDLEYLDWLLKYIGKDAHHAADAIANLSQQMGEYEDSLAWAKTGISEIFGLHGIAFNFDNADPAQLYQELADFMNAQNLESQLTEKEAEALQSYLKTMMDSFDGMYDSWIEAHEHMMDAWNEWNDMLEEGISDIATYGDELENIQKIVDLTGRKLLKMSTQDLNKMNQAIVANSQEQLRAEKALLDAQAVSMAAAEQAYQNAITENLSQDVIDKLHEEWRQIKDDYDSQLNDYYKTWQDTLNKAEDAFSRMMENITKDYQESFGKMDLDYLADQFKRQQDLNDLYLDDYEKYHELNKTSNELAKSLANTNNALIKGKMLDLQDEINASMENGVQISEAQAEIYARRVALLQAEAELLDAQNAKSAVRMTRDNEGNFSYTYTADADKVGDAQDNYGDKFYELLDYERNYMDEVQSDMLQKRQEFMDRLNEISEMYWDDQDAYNQALMDLREEYLIYMDYFVGEQEMDMWEMKRLRDDDWLDFQDITQLKLAEHDDFITHFKDTIYGDLADAYETAAEDGANWQHAMEEACQMATIAVNAYQANTKTTYEMAGENIETYGNKVLSKMDSIVEKSGDTSDAVVDMSQDMQEEMAQIQNSAWQLDAAWGSVMDDMRNQISATVSALYTLMQSLDQTTAKAQATINAVAAAAAASAAMGYGDIGGTGGNSDSGTSGVAAATKDLADALNKAPNTGKANNHGGGCFDAGTKIIMSDLSIKNIENIKIGDKVMAYNDESGLFEPRVVTKSYVHHNTPAMIKVVLSNGIVMDMTPGHPLLSTTGWKSMDIENSLYEHNTVATWLRLGDEIIGFNGNAIVVNISWRVIGPNYDTYNIEVDTCHTFIANGMVVHNAKVAQQAMSYGVVLPSSYLRPVDKVVTGKIGFATGGYTGAWGDDGKLAILHEKELVLNKEDTENMLNVISMVRSITDAIGSNTGLNNLLLAAGGSTGLMNGLAQSLDQNVHIEASFPNVQSHTEIELALNNLINSASQYVNRK